MTTLLVEAEGMMQAFVLGLIQVSCACAPNLMPKVARPYVANFIYGPTK